MSVSRRMPRLAPAVGPAIAGLLYVVMYVVYAANEAGALSEFGISNLLNDTVVLAIAAAGLTLTVLAAEFDLSGIGVIAIANVVVATTSGGPAGWLLSLIEVLTIGAAVGLLNGWLVSTLRLQSLAVTIATMIACEGVALLVLAAPGGEVPDSITNGLTGSLFGVPVAALIILGVLALWFLLASTRLGIAIYAVGADENAARLSGLSVRRTKLLAFVLAGVAYGFAGYMLSAQTGSGDPRASDSFLLFMYAAVAIGGASLSGGRGGVLGSVIGAGILTVMQKMLFALGAASFYTDVFSGVIMLVAILIGTLPTLLPRLRWLAPA
ncbi:MAG TPA: ABC transporter permease [Roseiarcus sp.]|nr:ABC transporter permease [Roseiarcus sp.]